MNMQVLQQMELPQLPDNNNVDDILKGLRIRVGLEEAEQAPIDPFSQQFNTAPINQEPEDMWSPVISEATNSFAKKQEEQEITKNFVDSDIYKHFEKLDNSFFDRLAEEVDSPDTPFNESDAIELITQFISEEVDKYQGALSTGQGGM
ncbi:hypothetical protein [Vibrio vulnificus]|uniref:hypothetical protein n=1 Tax=Vibrio vulnificus TaxID=672 RepID=UPI0015939D14|nr:hypothetical protein [Vibrio vulnificus]NVC72608.1 hypothetical protein [Vibrio vulnificus]